MLERLNEKEMMIEETIQYLLTTTIAPVKINPLLEKKNESVITENDLLAKMLRRTNITASDIAEIIPDEKIASLLRRTDVCEQVEIDVKYEGYIQRQNEQIHRFAKFEEYLIPENFDYMKISSLCAEAKEKLHRVRPRSIGQASRIAGVTNADVAVLSIFLKQLESQ
jgi:tRNA uridine 5-carboxymethylaminomethyl modification enzyme